MGGNEHADDCVLHCASFVIVVFFLSVLTCMGTFSCSGAFSRVKVDCLHRLGARPCYPQISQHNVQSLLDFFVHRTVRVSKNCYLYFGNADASSYSAGLSAIRFIGSSFYLLLRLFGQ